MRLNRSTGHAIRIMLECARIEPELVKVADLAAALDLSMQNVFKIVHILSHAGLVACARGRHGGVRLSRDAEDIRLGDIVRAMEATDLAEDDRVPTVEARRAGETDINEALELALGAFVDVLDQHTLASMRGPGPLRQGTEARADVTSIASRRRVVRGATARATS